MHSEENGYFNNSDMIKTLDSCTLLTATTGNCINYKQYR